MATKKNAAKLPFEPPKPKPSPNPGKPIAAKHLDAKKPTTADVKAAYTAPSAKNKSPHNALGDPTASLQGFVLEELAQFTKENAFATDASLDVHLFFVGRDDVHGLLKYILSRVTNSLYLNMFGFDDSELNNILMQKALDPNVTMLITLDKSQAGGVHEKALLDADKKYNLASFNTHFAIGESLTKQISHTKGFVADGRVAAEGSVNWSSSGEGTFVTIGQPGGAGYKAQNNTQSVITDPDTIVRFQTELITEHMTAKSQEDSSNDGITQEPVPPLDGTGTTPAKKAPRKSAEKAATK
jgi:hypothetical protein